MTTTTMDPRDRQLAQMAVVQGATWSPLQDGQFQLRNTKTPSRTFALVWRRGSHFEGTVFLLGGETKQFWALTLGEAQASAESIAMKAADRGAL